MTYTGNYMIDGDTGDNPSSPYYRPRYRFTCDHCGMPSEGEGVAVTYGLDGEDEDAPLHHKNVCEDCHYSMKKNPIYNLI